MSPAVCEVNRCGVIAIGRCETCGHAFCGSHQSVHVDHQLGIPIRTPLNRCVSCQRTMDRATEERRRKERDALTRKRAAERAERERREERERPAREAADRAAARRAAAEKRASSAGCVVYPVLIFGGYLVGSAYGSTMDPARHILALPAAAAGAFLAWIVIQLIRSSR